LRRHKSRGNAERFVMLPHWMLKCPAWRTLSPNAKAVLLHLWERHNGTNNGEITYGVREAEDIDLSKDQVSRALSELVGRGFLRIVRNSAFSVKTKEARLWALTAERIGDKPATKDFMYWSGPQPRSRKRDRGHAGKSETRSHQRDTQSHQRDRAAGNETILPVSVALARLSEPKSIPSRSHQRDTSNIPYVPAKARGGVTAQESDPAARAKRRIIDDDEDLGGGPRLLADVIAAMAAQ
jgi:hypothetical protein